MSILTDMCKVQADILTFVVFFSVTFAGLITIIFIGRKNLSVEPAAHLCVLPSTKGKHNANTPSVAYAHICAITWIVSTGDWFLSWLFVFLKRGTALCIQHDWCKGCCLLHLPLAVQILDVCTDPIFTDWKKSWVSRSWFISAALEKCSVTVCLRHH